MTQKSKAKLLQAIFNVGVEPPALELGYYVIATGIAGLSHPAVETLRQFYHPSDSFALVNAVRTNDGVMPSLRDPTEKSCVLASGRLVDRWAATQRPFNDGE